MTLTVEHDGPVTTLIRDRRAARNAMNPESAVALTEALLAFDRDEQAFVAVLWGAGGAFCAGFDLKYAAMQLGQKDPMAPLNFPEGEGPVPRGPMGPTRLQLSKPVIAAVCRPRRRRRHGTRALVRPARDGGERLHGRLLPALGVCRSSTAAPCGCRGSWDAARRSI
jgi:hypothetical protein